MSLIYCIPIIPITQSEGAKRNHTLGPVLAGNHQFSHCMFCSLAWARLKGAMLVSGSVESARICTRTFYTSVSFPAWIFCQKWHAVLCLGVARCARGFLGSGRLSMFALEHWWILGTTMWWFCSTEVHSYFQVHSCLPGKLWPRNKLGAELRDNQTTLSIWVALFRVPRFKSHAMSRWIFCSDLLPWIYLWYAIIGFYWGLKVSKSI